jgi:YaiO family outer membrane protein
LKNWLLPLIALAAAAPLQAQQSAYDAAVAARLGGDPAAAVTLLEPIVAADPAHADAQVQLGYALLALGRALEAERAFRAALKVAPAYADAQTGLATAIERQRNAQSADRELAARDPSSSDVQTPRNKGGGSSAYPWSLDVDGNYSLIDGPQPDWREGTVQVRRRFSPAVTANARIEVSRRFDRTDVYGELGLDRAVGSRGHVYLTFGGTPDADFRPRWQVAAGGSWRLTDGGQATVLTFDGRHSEFVSGDVQTLSPGIEQYLLGGRAWITARWINLFDEDGDHQSGFLVRGNVQASDRLRLFVGHADAPDTSEGVVIETRSYFGGLAFDFSDRLVGRVNLAVDDRESGSDRTQIGAGFGFRF